MTDSKATILPEMRTKSTEASSNTVMPHSCATCKKSTETKCEACAYDEETGVEQPTFYCSTLCQKQDWPSHKIHCREISNVNQLYRAAKTIQAAFYCFRRHLFDLNIKRICTTESKILLCEDQKGGHLFFPFPEDLLPNEGDQEAVLSCRACTDGVTWMDRLFEKLLQGCNKEIKEVSASVKNNRKEVSIVGRKDMIFIQKGQEWTGYPHAFLKVTMKHGTAYALDVAGAQYGYTAPVCRWVHFEADRIRHIWQIMDFGYTRRNSFRLVGYFPTDPVFDKGAANQLLVAESLERALDKWIDSQTSSPVSMLRGSKAKSEVAIREMIRIIEGAVHSASAMCIKSAAPAVVE